MRGSILSLLLVSLSSAMGLKASNNLLSKQIGGWLDREESTTSRVISPSVESGPMVLTPRNEDVWQHGRRVVTIEWDGIDGSLVKIFLFYGTEEIALLSGWIENEGRFREMLTVDESWGSGDGYYVILEDNLGNTLSGESFSIRSNLQIQDADLGSWATGQRNVSFRWNGTQGTSVRITLEKNDGLLAVLCEWELDQGSFQIPFPIPPEWGTGDGYTIRVEDNLGNSDVSTVFRIQPILVLSPQPGTEWTVGEPVPDLRWAGANNVVRICLRRSVRETAEIAGWMDNTGQFRYSGNTPDDWAPERLADYELAIVDDLGDEGIVYPVYIGHTDDTFAGAMPLVSHGSDVIETEEDIDYWVVEAIRGNKYKVAASDTVTVTLQVLSSNGTQSVTQQSVGEVAWQASRTGEYIEKVASKLGATGSYSISFGRAFGIL